MLITLLFSLAGNTGSSTTISFIDFDTSEIITSNIVNYSNQEPVNLFSIEINPEKAFDLKISREGKKTVIFRIESGYFNKEELHGIHLDFSDKIRLRTHKNCAESKLLSKFDFEALYTVFMIAFLQFRVSLISQRFPTHTNDEFYKESAKIPLPDCKKIVLSLIRTLTYQQKVALSELEHEKFFSSFLSEIGQETLIEKIHLAIRTIDPDVSIGALIETTNSIIQNKIFNDGTSENADKFQPQSFI
ncbi:MAG: hypothetical protein LCH30_00830 [Proteobacteria bacterium]|nr:hypothetical protein [Pseudomonadota bacterium]